MRRRVSVVRENDQYAVGLTKSQHFMVVNSVRTFLGLVPESCQRSLILGPGWQDLLKSVEEAKARKGSDHLVEIPLSDTEAHALFALLVWLPGAFNSEEEFVNRVGAFREHLTNMAQGFLAAVGNSGEAPHDAH